MHKDPFAWLVVSMILIHSEVQLIIPSFPELGNFFAVSDYRVSLFVTSNMLGFCLGSPFYGVLCDKWGIRRCYLFGSSVFLIGCLGCFLVTTYDLFCVFRFVQGIGAAVAGVVGFSQASKAGDEQKVAFRLGVLNGVVTFALAGGPVLGNILQSYFGAVGNLTCILCFAVINLILIWRVLPADDTSNLLQQQQQQQGWNGYLQCLRNPVFMLSILTKDLAVSAYLIYFSWSAFVLVDQWGMSSYEYGVVQFLIVVSYSVVTLFAGRLWTRFGPGSYILVSLSAWLVAWICASQVVEPVTEIFAANFWSIVCYSVGGALAVQFLFITAFMGVEGYKSQASAVAAVSRFSFPALALALWGRVYPPSWLGVRMALAVFATFASLGLLCVLKLRGSQHVSGKPFVPDPTFEKS
ncbi:MAG: MFS transporter [Zetaproteobacteria bacterium]|nr:MFS transporter [Zetaproteobacteria bacterium]